MVCKFQLISTYDHDDMDDTDGEDNKFTEKHSLQKNVFTNHDANQNIRVTRCTRPQSGAADLIYTPYTPWTTPTNVIGVAAQAPIPLASFALCVRVYACV